MSRPLRWSLLLLGSIWTAPNTFVGLLLGAAGLLRGARCVLAEGAVAFLDFPWGPGGALTLGQTILVRGTSLDSRCSSYACRAGIVAPGPDTVLRLGDHERAHVLQYLLFGPLFLPLYAFFGGISVRNRFERSADRYALGQGGWWPWSV